MKILSYFFVAVFIAALTYLSVSIILFDWLLFIAVTYILVFIAILYGAANFKGGNRSGKLRR